MSLLGVSYHGLKIGISERESVIKCGAPVYGYFTLVLNRETRQYQIEKVKYLTQTFGEFRGEIYNRMNKPLIKSILCAFASIVGVSLLITHLHYKSKKYWKKYLALDKKPRQNEVSYQQKRVYCNNCGKVPSNVLFEGCGHLVYCDDCFGKIHEESVGQREGQCLGIVCDDCGKGVKTYRKIFYT